MRHPSTPQKDSLEKLRAELEAMPPAEVGSESMGGAGVMDALDGANAGQDPASSGGKEYFAGSSAENPTRLLNIGGKLFLCELEAISAYPGMRPFTTPTFADAVAGERGNYRASLAVGPAPPPWQRGGGMVRPPLPCSHLGEQYTYLCIKMD